MEENMRELNPEETANVTGGIHNGIFAGAGKPLYSRATDDKMAEFETAWKALNMDLKNYSGSMKAAIYKEWELNDYQPGALDFLKVL